MPVGACVQQYTHSRELKCTVVLLDFYSRSLLVKVQPEKNRNQKKLDGNRLLIRD